MSQEKQSAKNEWGHKKLNISGQDKKKISDMNMVLFIDDIKC